MKCKWSKKYKLSKILLTSSLLISSISFSILASSCSNNDFNNIKPNLPNQEPNPVYNIISLKENTFHIATGDLLNYSVNDFINANNNYNLIKIWIFENKESIFNYPESLINLEQIIINRCDKYNDNSINVNFSLSYVIIDNNGNKGSLNNKVITITNLDIVSQFAKYYDNFVKLPDGTIFVNPSLTSLINNNDPNLSNELKKQKELVLKYGTFPIDINLKDSDISIQSLVKMFDIMAYLRLYGLTFGNRNIDAKLVAIALAQWWISKWKYFPYVTYNNPARIFRIKDLNTEIPNTDSNMFQKKWYVESTENGNYANQWLFAGLEQKAYIDFVSRFLQGIDPNMTDLDKLFYTYFYVGSWVNYGGGGTLIDTISKHEGVCIQYATLLSFCLNLINIPSIPMNAAMGDLSNKPDNQHTLGPHAVTWLYIEAFPDQGKKWYVSDATFGDTANMMSLTYSTWKSGFNYESNMISNLLFCNTINGPFTPDTNIHYNRWSQYNNNIFFELPFSMVYDAKYINEIGSAAIGSNTFFDVKNFLYKYANNFSDRSKFFNFNNEWYFVAKKNGESNYGLFKGSLNSWEVIDISNNIPSNIKSNILSKPMLLKFGDFFVFNQNDKSFRLHNMNNDQNWNNDLIINIDNEAKKLLGNSNIGDFYIDGDGYINIYKESDVTSGVNLSIEPIKLKTNLYNLILDTFSKRDKNLAKIFFEYLAGVKKIKLYDFDFGIDIDTKKQYCKDLNNIFLDNSLSNKIAIMEMKKKYDELSYNCFSSFNNLGLLRKVSKNDYISKENYDKYGYNFNIYSWSNPAFENIFDVYQYDVYYSKIESTNKQDFKLLAKNTYSAKINKDILIDPTGYYFIRAYSQKHYYNYVDSDFIHLTLVHEPQNILNENYQQFYNNAVKFTTYGQNRIQNLTSNFDYDNPNIYNEKINIEFNISTVIDLLKYRVKCSINFINKSTKETIVLEEHYLDFPNNNWNFSKSININETTHGLYYVKIELIDKETNNIFNIQYSKNSYLFTKSDTDNFNLNEWKALFDLIQ